MVHQCVIKSVVMWLHILVVSVMNNSDTNPLHELAPHVTQPVTHSPIQSTPEQCDTHKHINYGKSGQFRNDLF